MGLCGVGESHTPDAFAAVLNPTTDTHLSATRIHNDGIMQGAALPSTPPVWVATRHGAYTPAPPGVSIHATRVGGDRLYGYKDALSFFVSMQSVLVPACHRRRQRFRHPEKGSCLRSEQTEC